MGKIIERRGDQVYVEKEDWDGNLYYEWEYSPVQMCACGQREASSCKTVKETTFTETYQCGFVFHYSNANGYEDRVISINGKRV